MSTMAVLVHHWLCLIFVIFSSKYAAGSDLGSLTFVIDETSSMMDDIYTLQRGANAIFDTVQNHKNESQIDNFVLVTFNDYGYSNQCTDPGLRVRANTRDRNVFMEAMHRIFVSGGGLDCAECSMAGTQLGLEKSLPRSLLYVFTDATANDYNRFEQVKIIAQDKQSQIVFVLTGDCAESHSSPSYNVYQDLANATNGQVLRIRKNQVNEVLEYLKKTITGRRTTLSDTVLQPGVNNITLNADTIMEEVILSLTSSKLNDLSVNITASDGSDVSKEIVIDTDTVKIYSLNATTPGLYTVEASGSVDTRAVVSAKLAKSAK